MWQKCRDLLVSLAICLLLQDTIQYKAGGVLWIPECSQLLSHCFVSLYLLTTIYVSSLSVSCLSVSLSFLTLFLRLLLFLFSFSLYSLSLPSSFCVSTPPPPPTPLLFALLPSWQQCQSGLADRGKHSTGQSRGRSKRLAN